ncbi:MAG: hypothetical protein JSU92_07635 [Deltaproteobacteria bacterium]|nr:MAG: hypothetical protein JSU92_07635 [Deltaproteobacteria bacterium]
MSIWIAILLSIIGTTCMNSGLVLWKKAAVNLPKVQLGFNPQTLLAFLTSGTWMLGFGIVIIGWILYLIAVANAPISIIQPAIGFGLVILALFSVFYLKEDVKLREWVAVAMMILGIALLGLSADPSEAEHVTLHGYLLLIVSIAVSLTILLFILLQKYFIQNMNLEVVLGIATGLVMGLAALYTKALFNCLDGGDSLLAFAFFLPLVIASNFLGITIMQSGFQRGKALIVVSLSAVINKIVAIIGGMVSMGEHLPEDPLLATGRILAFVFILFGTGLLARFGGEGKVDS